MKSNIFALIFLTVGLSASIVRCLSLGPDEICCPDTGCFSKAPPFNNLPLPECAEEFKVRYTMYTRDSATEGELLDKDKVPTKFKGERRTVFICHGFIENDDYVWMTTMKDAFLKREDVNVVVMDWSNGGSNLYYFQPASNTRSVGAYTAVVIKSLLLQPNTNSSRFWCVGHSLGSHVCGHTGMSMPSDQPLGRATGLDPAGPAFEDSPDLKIGINPTCATFVDNLHTSKIMGTERALGHIDFYPTGHKLKLDFSFDSAFEWGVVCGVLCSHKRSVDFMIASLRGTDTCFSTDMTCDNENNLPGSCHKDAGCVEYMGYGADHGCSMTGVHYLEVPPRAPFCPVA